MKTIIISWKKILIGLILIVVGFIGGLLVVGFPPTGKGYHTIDEIEQIPFVIYRGTTVYPSWCSGPDDPCNCNTLCAGQGKICAYSYEQTSTGYVKYMENCSDLSGTDGYCVCWP